METSNKLIGEQLSLWTSSAEDIPVNHSAQQENEKEQMTQDTYGHGLEQPLANYDPDTQSWRMLEDISLWGDYKLLESLPKSGMTRNGVLYQQPVWVRPIDVTESLSWPTPRNCSAMAATITPESAWNPKRFPNLETVVGRRMWPTPTTQEVEHPNAELTPTGRRKSKNGKTSHSLGLADAVQMWPTPQANDAKNPYARIREYSQALMLGEAVLRADPSTNGGKLNPMWVEWLMGFPIGWTDLED